MSICIALAFAAYHDHQFMSFIVKTAFLHAKLSTVIYCKQILGFPEAEPSTDLHLLVALYGLHQSSYDFYMLLCKLMTHLGMTRCEFYHTIFYGFWSSPPVDTMPMPSNGNDLILMMPVHVNDSLAVMNLIPLYNWFINELSKKLEMVDL